VSFDLFVDRFEAGRPIGASEQGFEKVFGPHVTKRDVAFSFCRLSFGEHAGADAYLGDGAFMFNRFSGERFFALLFEYLSDTRSVAYWPGEGCSAAVVDASLVIELPEDMIKQLRPAVVRSSVELAQTILR
jgi:hypothetical protein